MAQKEALLIEFWFTNCRYCIESIPKLTELHNTYKNKGLKIVYANALFNESNNDIIKFKEKHKIIFDVYNFGNIFEHGSLPTLMLVDKQGVIKCKTDGYSSSLKEDIIKIMEFKN